MSFLDDLLFNYGQLEQQGEAGHIGAWGLPEFGITEAYASAISPGETDLGDAIGDKTIVPYVANYVTGGDYSAPSTGGGGGGGGGGAGNDAYFWDAADGWKLKTGGDGSGGSGGSNDGGMSAQIALAQGAYNNAMRDLQSVFGQARGVYDQGIGAVGKIRDRATESFNTGRDNILNRFTGERGNLQRESVGNKNRLRSSLRALGMGGSAFVRGIGNQDKANARAIGSLRQSRGSNELANTQQQTQSFDFADTQQGALDRFLQQASRALQSGQEKASLVQQGDVAGINSGFNQLRSDIFSSNQALTAAGGAAAGYTVNPFAVNIQDMIGSLNSGLPQFTGQTAVEGGNVNFDQENLSYLERLKRGLL